MRKSSRLSRATNAPQERRENQTGLVWLLTIGFSLAMVLGVSLDSIVDRLIDGVISSTGLRLVVGVARAVLLLLLAILSDRVEDKFVAPGMVLSCMVFGAACLIFGVNGPDAEPVPFVFACLAEGVAWVAWIRLVSMLDVRFTLQIYLMSGVLSSMITTVLLLGVDTVTVLPMIVVFLLSGILYVLAARKSPGEDPAVGEDPERYFPYRAVCLMFLFVLVCSFCRNGLPVSDYGFTSIGGGVACLMFLFLYAIKGPNSLREWSLYKTAAPLAATALLFVAVDLEPWGILAAILANASSSLINVFLFAVMSNLAYRYNLSAISLFGYTGAASNVAAACGLILWRVSPPLPDGPAVVILAILTLSVGFGATFLFENCEDEFVWGVRHHPLDDPLLEESMPEKLKDRCASLSRKHGLTRREEETIYLLALGNSPEVIAQRLVISIHTVRSHINSAYRKTGVHGRDALVAYMLEEM